MTVDKFDFYDTPDQEVFDDIKACAIKIWQGYDDTYGYASEKITIVEKITNIKDNAWTIVAMFDVFNQEKLYNMVSDKTKAELLKLLRYVGTIWFI